jgi:hypothetical protein
MTREKAEELRVVLKSVGLDLLGISESLRTETGFKSTSDGNLVKDPPDLWLNEDLRMTLEVKPLLL